jgi:hypothetical protein
MSKIEKDTQIIPWLVAETVLDEVVGSTGADEIYRSQKIIDYLVDHAAQVYAHNVTFRKKVQSEADHGNAGRDYLYTFMEHWLASYLKEHEPKIYKALPHGYGWSYSPSVEKSKATSSRVRRTKRARR